MILSAVDFQKSLSTERFAAGYLLVGNELHFRDRFRALLVKSFAGGRAERL